jgi:hypothetical protein
VTITTGALGVLAAAFLAYIITWFTSFMARLLDAPAAMFYEQKGRADALQQQLDILHPLEIIFDPTNPHNRFWERTSPRDETGKKLLGLVWEYRVKVQNTSLKTVKNVRISRESSGEIPEMPSDLVFHKDEKKKRDLQPLCGEFITVLCKFPPQAGDAWGETATAFHGPIKIIARGDNVAPDECEFDYYPDQIPAIVQRVGQ